MLPEKKLPNFGLDMVVVAALKYLCWAAVVGGESHCIDLFGV